MTEKKRRPTFGATRCRACGRYDCLDHISVEEDYPDSAWNVERHDYGPREGRRER